MTVTATPQPGNVPPRVQVSINLSAASPVPGEVTVYRIDGEGASTAGRLPLRTGEPAVLSGGVWADFDYEAPFGLPVTYEAHAADGRVWASSVVTLTVPDVWLRHVGIPDLSMRMPRLLRGSLSERTTPARRGVFQVMGRPRPIVVSSGTRGDGDFELSVFVNTPQEQQALDALLADQSALLIGCSPSLGWDLPQAYVSVGDVQTNRFGGVITSPNRSVSLPCMVVDRPRGAVLTQWTFDAAGQTYATVADLMANYTTVTNFGIDVRRDAVPAA